MCVQFSEDDQLLLTLTGAPEFTLACWNWAKAKVIASTQVGTHGAPMYKCSFNPVDASVACAVGKDAVKFFRIVDRDMRLLQENLTPNHNFTSHCWMRAPDDHLLAGTEDGKMVLYRSGEYLYHIPCPPGPNFPIYSIQTMPGGFICGSQKGTFVLYLYDETRDQALFENQFQMVASMSTELCAGNIVSMALNPAEDYICTVTSDGQLLSIPAVSASSMTSDMISYTISPFHACKGITGLDVCTRKPLMVTCSKDNTVRLWNFQLHQMELMKSFPEDMYSVALHPTGLQLAIGFVDKLRIYHILVDELRLCMEVSIKVRE